MDIGAATSIELGAVITVALAIFIPCCGCLFGGIIYWLRKMDDRLFEVRGSNLTKADLHRELTPMYAQMRGLEEQISEVRRVVLDDRRKG